MPFVHKTSSGFWKHGLLSTMLFGFSVMLVGGFFMYRSRAPIPESVVSPTSQIPFTAADIQAGQELFRKRNLMNYGGTGSARKAGSICSSRAC